MSKKKAKFSINKLPQVPEGLSHANPNREACKFCGLYRKSSEPFRMPQIDDEWTGRLLLITETLAHECKNVIRRAYKQAGYCDEDVAFAPSLRCRSEKSNMGQIRACRPFLLKVINVLKPRAVLGLGATALRALTNKSDANLTKRRGQLISLKGKKK